MAMEGWESKDLEMLDLKTIATLTIVSVPVIFCCLTELKPRFKNINKITLYINSEQVSNHKLS